MFINARRDFDNFSVFVTPMYLSQEISFHVANFEAVLSSILDGYKTQNILSPQALHCGPSGDTKRSTRQI